MSGRDLDGPPGPANQLSAWWPHRQRLVEWRQVPDLAVPDAGVAAELIGAVGLATVYPASAEVANLFHAHVGNPGAKTESKWDSPSGLVYSWRWSIGRAGLAFYGTVVRKRPTFVSWPLLPAILRLVADLRTPDELFDFGVISGDAYKIARALDASSEPIGTGEIRKEAGFPTGKENSARYHKALAELENRLLITTEFVETEGEGTKHHALIFERLRKQVDTANAMSGDSAIDQLLMAYLATAVYIQPVPFSKHVRISNTDLLAGLNRLESRNVIRRMELPGTKREAFVDARKIPAA